MYVQKPDKHYDIAVIGAGMVGANFALALCEKLNDGETSVLVVEAARSESSQLDSPSFDDRSTALSFGSSKILQKIGLWDPLVENLTSIEKIHVSDRGHFGSAQLDKDSEGVSALGYVVENRRFGHVLNSALLETQLIDFLAPAKVQDINPVSNGMQLTLIDEGASEYSVDADLVVLADGGRSPICRQLGITIDSEQYGQQALISNVAFEESHGNVAYERFTESGPLAILPLPRLNGENRGALVWTVSEESAKEMIAADDVELVSDLQECFGYRLGRFSRIGKRFCYPLSLQVAREQVRPGLVLLGNVAHTLHPVAGQGFNLALRDVEVLAKVLAGAIKSNKSPGAMEVLQNFLTRQQSDQARTISFSHYLTRLFSSDRGSLVWARKFGLASIDILPLVKHEFARGAMGLADR